jgi:hypothetical protein
MQAGNRHLEFRAGHWHYNRRVPARFAAYDDRGRIRVSLKTTSLDTARERRDALKEADDLFWASLCGLDDGEPGKRGAQALQSVAQRRYQAAGKRAMARSFTYAQRVHFGQPIGLLMRAYGHCSERETMRYLGILPSEVRALYLNEV